MKKKSILTLPATRVKKIIQNDKNIGKLSAPTPYVVGKATEFFIEELVKNSSKLATERGDSKITAWHLSQVLHNDPKFAFIQSKALNHPTILASQEPKKSKKKQESKEVV